MMTGEQKKKGKGREAKIPSKNVLNIFTKIDNFHWNWKFSTKIEDR